jgi:hypothetical protein
MTVEIQERFIAVAFGKLNDPRDLAPLFEGGAGLSS